MNLCELPDKALRRNGETGTNSIDKVRVNDVIGAVKVLFLSAIIGLIIGYEPVQRRLSSSKPSGSFQT